MLFYNFFVSKLNTNIEIVLKNDLEFQGKLISIDPFLNIKLEDLQILNRDSFGGIRHITKCSIRGSSVKFIMIPYDKDLVDNLEDASRFRFIKH